MVGYDKGFTIILGVLLVCLGARGQTTSQPYQGFHNFLEYTMTGFTEWAIEQGGMDPMPPLNRSFDLSINTGLFNLFGSIWNTSGLGLSTQFSIYLDESSFANLKILLAGQVNTGGISGNYNASGSVLGSFPIGGNSWWRLLSSPFNLEFHSFFYLENGYIQLNDTYYKSYPQFNFSSLTGSFNELLTPDTERYEEQILRGLAENINSLFYEAPLYSSAFHRYLQNAFSVTPVIDILNWPAPSTSPYPTMPTTTSPPYSSTTTQYTNTATTRPTLPTTTEQGPCSDLNSITSEGMNNFLTSSLRNYPQYLINNGLDPTAPIINPMVLNLNSSFLRLDGTFRNTAGSNMSRGLDIEYVQSEFISPSFLVRVYFPAVSVNGYYDAFGEIVSLYPISGSGNWQIRDFSLGLSIRITGFAIEGGYINIRNYESRQITLYDAVTDVEEKVLFPDLVTPQSADGLGIEVLGILGDLVPEMLEREGKHPIVNSVLDYLNFKFSNTPITEIIGTTRPPCK